MGGSEVRKLISALFSILFVASPAVLHSGAQPRGNSAALRPLVEVLGANAPYSLPEKAVVERSGNLYVLDKELSNIFLLDMAVNRVSPICAPRLPHRVADMSLGEGGGIWLLDAQGSNVFRLDKTCRVHASFPLQRRARRLQVNTFGEVAALALEGETLFDLYDAGGRLIRSFGKRIKHGDAVADSELNNGQLISDRAGGFYFSFNYPPLVQRFRRDGKLLAEFSPKSDVAIAPPDIRSRREGGRLIVTSRYQILVLGLDVDEQGRLLLLMSGEDKFQALTRGTRDLLVTTGRGRVLKRVTAEQEFHRVAAGRGVLYLLRNRGGLSLMRYAMP